MPLAGAANLAVVLDGVASQSSAYDEPRALTLFGMLEANREHLKANEPPEKPTDITGRDGVVYRFFPARGFQFHPLANFAALNGHVSRRATPPTRSAWLLPSSPAGFRTAMHSSGSTTSPFGGPTRWTSGFAQAVAADALSRTSALVHDPKLRDAAKAAFLGTNELSLQIGGGSSVREYGFSDIVILNAQLQTTLNISRFARTSGDADARAFAARLETASRNLLPRFDKGCWSLYSLGGGNACVVPPVPHQAPWPARRAGPGWALARSVSPLAGFVLMGRR